MQGYLEKGIQTPMARGQSTKSSRWQELGSLDGWDVQPSHWALIAEEIYKVCSLVLGSFPVSNVSLPRTFHVPKYYSRLEFVSCSTVDQGRRLFLT